VFADAAAGCCLASGLRAGFDLNFDAAKKRLGKHLFAARGIQENNVLDHPGRVVIQNLVDGTYTRPIGGHTVVLIERWFLSGHLRHLDRLVGNVIRP
jgi:hypothetical protein